MIDSNAETLISLTEAARLLPRRRRGKRPHVSCLYRWTTTGCKGVVLESIQVGGTRCTSKEALARFFQRLTYADPPEPTRSPTRRRHAAERAQWELERQGV
jgi:hypothetical protein